MVHTLAYLDKLGKYDLARFRGGSRTAATSKMEHFVIIVNGFQPLAIITKSPILDVVAVLDPPLRLVMDYQTECDYVESLKVSNKQIWKRQY